MPHPDTLDRRTTAVVRRSRLAAWLTAAGTTTLVAALAAGMALLVGRSLFGVDPLAALDSWLLASGLGARVPIPSPAWPFALFTLALLPLTWTVRRALARSMTAESAALWLDIRAGATGELVTQREVGASAAAWRGSAEARARSTEALPDLPVRGASLRVGLGLAFLGAALFTPVRTQASATDFGSLFDERLEEVGEQLTALQEEVALDEEDLAELERTLERLEADARDNPDLEATYEAIDRLEERLAERAEEARAAAERATEGLARAQESLARSDSAEAPKDATDALAEALEAAQGLELEALDPAQIGAAFADMLAEAKGVKPGELAGLDLSKLAELAREGGLAGLDPAALAELSDALKEAMKGSLSDLIAAGLLDAAALKSLDQLPKLTPEQLAKLAACPDCGRLDPKEPGEP